MINCLRGSVFALLMVLSTGAMAGILNEDRFHLTVVMIFQQKSKSLLYKHTCTLNPNNGEKRCFTEEQIQKVFNESDDIQCNGGTIKFKRRGSDKWSYLDLDCQVEK